jgi:hypothetical protein
MCLKRNVNHYRRRRDVWLAAGNCPTSLSGEAPNHSRMWCMAMQVKEALLDGQDNIWAARRDQNLSTQLHAGSKGNKTNTSKRGNNRMHSMGMRGHATVSTRFCAGSLWPSVCHGTVPTRRCAGFRWSVC